MSLSVLLHTNVFPISKQVEGAEGGAVTSEPSGEDVTPTEIPAVEGPEKQQMPTEEQVQTVPLRKEERTPLAEERERAPAPGQEEEQLTTPTGEKTPPKREEKEGSMMEQEVTPQKEEEQGQEAMTPEEVQAPKKRGRKKKVKEQSKPAAPASPVKKEPIKRPKRESAKVKKYDPAVEAPSPPNQAAARRHLNFSAADSMVLDMEQLKSRITLHIDQVSFEFVHISKAKSDLTASQCLSGTDSDHSAWHCRCTCSPR